MSGTEPPEVIQGRLGWESGDVSEAKPENLEPHPKNREIYGDTDDAGDLDETFKESVEEKGVLEPLVITNGKQIISGHRRWLAAQSAGLDSVPVRYAEFDTDHAEREALIEFNRQREKTPGQVVNEFEEILALEREQAEKRRKDATGHKETFPEAERGQSRDKAAEKVNADVSGRTLEKGLKVKKKAKEEDDETAREQWDKLQRGDTSFSRAHKEVEKAEAEKAVQEQESPDDENDALVSQQDAVEFLQAVESPDLVIADPPYSTDVDDVSAFAREWVGPMLEAIGDSGRAFVFTGAYPEELQAYLNALAEYGALDRTEVLVWTYRNTLGQSPKNGYKQNWQSILFIQSDPPIELDAPKTSEQWAVQDVNAPDARFGERHHEWEKPSELIRRLVRHTTDEGDTVIDPFVGTGTTVVEAAELGRETFGVDADPDMLELASDRGCTITDGF